MVVAATIGHWSNVRPVSYRNIATLAVILVKDGVEKLHTFPVHEGVTQASLVILRRCKNFEWQEAVIKHLRFSLCAYHDAQQVLSGQCISRKAFR